MANRSRQGPAGFSLLRLDVEMRYLYVIQSKQGVRLDDSSWPQLRNEMGVVTPEEWITSVRGNYFEGKNCGTTGEIQSLPESGAIHWTQHLEAKLMTRRNF
ncbi:hypothetical protein llap_2622 [Limosa lapponica baueri]|uniref:Uncharacterized protein n=1 Tax=Limosa lapponica baueri TaxID=1758121 RepID=A0A2I0UM24_LIMLA|nr:hypothetical protein llap_2622 [Limosa lapponica baueri]